MNDVPAGDANGLNYIVKYDEDQWNRYDWQRKDFCYAEWKRKALALQCRVVTLMLIPDPIFPSGEHTTMYRAWEHRFPKYDPEEYTTHYSTRVLVTVRLNTHTRILETGVFKGILEDLGRKFSSGTFYEIQNSDHLLLKRGEL